jgi:predicted ATP-grasp superfamily ATP-dependent carboligase
MENLFVPYEIALKLKEKGFDEPSLAYYDKDKDFIIGILNNIGLKRFISAPLYQQVVDWFREKHKIVIYVGLYDREDVNSWKYEITKYGEYKLMGMSKQFPCTYYEALTKAIEEALKLN